MKTIKKAMVGVMIGATLVGSTGVNAATLTINSRATMLATSSASDMYQYEYGTGRWKKTKDGRWWFQLTKVSKNTDRPRMTSYLSDGVFCIKNGKVYSEVAGGTNYAFDSDGYLITDCFWVSAQNAMDPGNAKSYYYHSDKNGQVDNCYYKWKKTSKGWKFGGVTKVENGKKTEWWAESRWVKLGNKKYYFDKNGIMKTGWINVSNKWYFLSSNGAAVTSTTKTIKGKAYRFDKNGVCLNP